MVKYSIDVRDCSPDELIRWKGGTCKSEEGFLSLIIVTTMLFSAALALASEDNLFEGMKTYDEGGYKVGRDFDAGEYVLLCTSSLPAYFSISSDANEGGLG